MQIRKKSLGIILISSFLLFPFGSIAQTISITQDDWSGGSGQAAWSDETKFNSEEGEGLYTVNGLRMKINADTVVGQDNFDNFFPYNATPKNNSLYVPRNTFYDGNKFFIVDSSNNRVLIYNSIPTTNGVAADVVIGQTDFTTGNSGISSAKLNYPNDVFSDGTKLFISDTSNNRVLIFNSIPTSNGAVADVVIGQDDFVTNTIGASSTKLNQPNGIYSDGTKLFIVDRYNNRVLIYNSIPTSNGAAADIVIGQDDFATNTSGTSATKLNYPVGISYYGTKLFVADISNSRVLIYNSIPTTNGTAADVVIGQTDFVTKTTGTSTTKLNYPSNVFSDGTKLFVADSSNNRVLMYNSIPTTNGVAADLVIGQTDFVTKTTEISSTKMSYPIDMFSDGTKLFVSDASNNRVLIYNSIPTTNGAAADVVVGQADFDFGKINAKTEALDDGFFGPQSSIFAGNKMVVADTDNHRVLIFNSIPTTNGTEADVVIGQPDFFTNTSGLTDSKMSGPGDLAYDGTRLYVADSGNHRILVYNSIPTTSGAPADLVIGQPNFLTGSYGTTNAKFRDPWGVASDGTRVYIADQGNHRILIYNSIPTISGAAADVVIGQTDFVTRTSGVSEFKFNAPESIFAKDGKLFVGDYSNSRVLIYNSIPTTNGAAADVVIGQPDFVTSSYGSTNGKFHTPEGIFFDGTKLFVADYINYRVLIYNSVPTENGALPDTVLGQADFDSAIKKKGGRDNVYYAYDVFYQDSKLLITSRFDQRLLIFNSDQVSSSLTSSTFTSETDQDWGPISFEADTPDNTEVEVFVSIDGGAWNKVTNNQTYLGRGKTMSYKITLISKDGLSTPTFQSISFGQAAKDDSGIITTLKNIFGNKDKLKLKNNQVIKSQSKAPTLKGEEPKLKNGKIQVYLNNELKKEITIDGNGVWNDKLKLKDKSYNITFKYLDEFNTILKTERIKLKVDSQKPTFKEKINKNQTVKRGQKITFSAKDEGLGIDHYKIKLLDNKGHVFKPFQKQTKDYYIIPQTLKDGNYTLVIKAYDEAKNYVQKKIDLRVGR